tara:strand:+ start:3546 stop:4190 length:645 start_codon:yes stop_codon:yes gene_type:complete
MDIPKIIYQTYKTKINQETIDELMLLNPGFDYKFFDDIDCLKFLQENFSEKIAHTFTILKSGAHKSDLFRYCLLLKYGGFYVDVDIKMSVSFDEIMKKCGESDLITVKSQHKGDGLYQGLLISKPGNKLFNILINNIIENPNPVDYGYYIKFFGSHIRKNNGCDNFEPFIHYKIDDISFYMFKEILYEDTKYVSIDSDENIILYGNGHHSLYGV